MPFYHCDMTYSDIQCIQDAQTSGCFNLERFERLFSVLKTVV